MTIEEIITHFGNNTVYQFTGSAADLHDLMMSASISYNNLIVNDIVYFITMNPIIEDERIQELKAEGAA